MGRGDVEPSFGGKIDDYTAAQALLNMGAQYVNEDQMQRVVDERTAEWHSVIE